MVRSKYLLGSGVAVFFATASLLCADPGYLPSVGPAELRFAVAEKPFKSVAISPKSAEVTSDPIEKEDSAALPTASAEPTQSLPPVAEKPLVIAEPNIRDEPSSPNLATQPELAPESTLSPQMFLKYFNKPNTILTLPVAPVEFKAPQPPQTPSSKATYTLSP